MKKHEKQGSGLGFIREKYILATATPKELSWKGFAISNIPCCISELLMYQTVVAHVGHRAPNFILVLSLSPHKGGNSYRLP